MTRASTAPRATVVTDAAAALLSAASGGAAPAARLTPLADGDDDDNANGGGTLSAARPRMAGATSCDSRCSSVAVALLAAALLWVLSHALSGRHRPAWPRHGGGGVGGAGGGARGFVVPRPRAFGNGTVFDFVLTADVRSGDGDDGGAAVYFVGPSKMRWHWDSFYCSFRVRHGIRSLHPGPASCTAPAACTEPNPSAEPHRPGFMQRPNAPALLGADDASGSGAAVAPEHG